MGEAMIYKIFRRLFRFTFRRRSITMVDNVLPLGIGTIAEIDMRGRLRGKP
jgi:hypothetical protein